MSTKAALIATAVLLAVVVCGGALLAVLLISGPRAEERAAQMGSGLGVLCAIGCAPIWILWAMKRRRE